MDAESKDQALHTQCDNVGKQEEKLVSPVIDNAIDNQSSYINSELTILQLSISGVNV